MVGKKYLGSSGDADEGKSNDATESSELHEGIS